MKNLKNILLSLMLMMTISFGYTHNTVAKVQKQLKELGYNPGIIDGHMGTHTRKAIKEFQKSIGKKATGRMNKTLLWELRNAQNSATAGFSHEAEEYNKIKPKE